MKTTRILLLLLLALLVTVPSAFAQTWDYNINFNQYAGNMGTNAMVITAGPATFRGAKPVTLTNVPGYPTVYWTDTYYGNCAGCSSSVTMEWTREVTNIQFMLINGVNESYGRTRYRLTDDIGHSQDFDMAGFYLEGTNGRLGLGPYAAEVRWPHSGVKKLTLQSLHHTSFWNFSIDNVRFDMSRATPTRVSAGYGDAPAPGAVNKLVPFYAVDAKFALGARFYLQLEEKRSDGSWVVVPSVMTYQTTGVGINPKPYTGLLFNNHVAIPFDESSGSKSFHTFQAVHLGLARVVLRPTTPNSQVTVNLTIDRPGALGSQGNQLDKWFIDEAHKTGIPPQYLKGQGEQETSADPFNPFSFRYELKTRDVNLIQDPNHPYHHAKAPFVDYRMADGKKLCPAPPLPGAATPEKCPFPGLDDIFRRQRYKIFRPDSTDARPIKPGDDPVTIRDIYNGHPNRLGLWGPDPAHGSGTAPGGKRRAVRTGPDPYAVIAQTTLGSSYGVLQTVYTDMIDKPNNWKGVNGRLNPGLLFDTPENLNRGGGSIPLGALKGMRDWRRGNPGVDPTKPRFKSFADFHASMKNMVAEYNPDPQYSIELIPRVAKYEPGAATPIFSASCSTPSISAQSQSITVPTSGEVALGVIASGGDLEYRWYRGTAGDTSHPIADAFDDAISVDVSGHASYWAQVSNACGTASTATISVNVTGGGGACSTPAINRHPEAKTIETGTPATISVGANGSGLRYQWYVGIGGDASAPGPQNIQAGDRTNPVAGATGPELTVQPLANTAYWVLVSNSCGETASYSAKVTVTCIEPSISTQATPVTIQEGESTSLSIAATGSALRYQWYVGSVGDTSQPVASGAAPTVTVTPVDSTTYWARVSNPCGQKDSAPVLVTVEHCVKPSIATPPQPVSIVEGDSATLSVTAAGTAALSHQWYAGTTALAGENASTLTVSPATTTSYSVVVTNACGEVTSAAAKVTVTFRCIRPFISAQPQSVSIGAGQSTTLSVATGGTDPKSYRWFANGVAITGETSASLTVSPSTTTTYHAIVSNDCGSVTSATATVTVNESCSGPQITSQPQSLSINAGQSATLHVGASGDGLSYQWFADGSPIAGANNASLVISPSQTTSYHVVVTNACSSVTSSTATVNVNSCAAPQITSQPQSVTVAGGQAATLRVTATGTSLSYQWFLANGAPIAGATGPAYTAAPSSTTSYYVVVSNACGSVNSATATIGVDCQVPVINFQPQSSAIQPGQSVTLTVGASGQQPFSYQWYANGSPVGNTISSSLTVTPSSTTQYYVVVSNVCGSTTSNVATVSVQSCLPATITRSPNDATIAPGETVTLSVQASGTGPLSYSWRNAAGAVIGTGPSITVSPTSSTSYTVRVTNDCGTDSATASVSVVDCPKPVVTVHPKSFEIWEGNSSFYEVVATSSTPLSYQWYANGVAMPGKTSRALDIAPTVTTQYFVDVTNACGTTRSNVGTVTVKPCTKPVIVSQPRNITITDGESATISATASGTAPITYTLIDQDRNTIASNNTGTFSVRPPVQAPYQWDYWIIASNGCGTEFSSSATVTVLAACTAPSVTSQPQSQSIVQGDSATLSVSASGTSPLTIEWFTSSGSQAGSGSSITVSPSSTTSYYARITNACGERTSATATVTVTVPCTPPSISSPTANVNTLLRYGNFRTLTVTASGSDLQYQWYSAVPAGSSFSPMPGATGPSITISPEETSDFRVRVSNSCGTVTSPMWHVVMWDGVGDPPNPNQQ